MAVQVSVTVPQATGVVVKVDELELPLIRHPPLNPLVNPIVLAAGIPPQATVIFPGAVIVGSAAGVTVIVLDVVIVLPYASVYDHDSVIVPPQGPTGVCELSVDVTEPVIAQGPVWLLV